MPSSAALPTIGAPSQPGMVPFFGSPVSGSKQSVNGLPWESWPWRGTLVASVESVESVVGIRGFPSVGLPSAS